jgi:hypothetical protein
MKEYLVKPIVALLGAGLMLSIFPGREAQAQRSGTMQATARVVDTHQGWSGLGSAQLMVGRLLRGESPVTLDNALSGIRVVVEKVPGSSFNQPARAEITIQYLRL